MKKIIFYIVLFISVNSYAKLKDVVIIHDTTISILKKETILILPGLEDSKKGRENLVKFFQETKYDVFTPNYIDKNSLSKTLINCLEFIMKHDLFKYKKLHVYSYITGSWTINNLINKYGKHNIKTIIYDRSPLQEMAPIIAVENIPKLTKCLKGNIVKNLSEMPFPKINTQDILIGILVESKATKFIKHYKKELEAKININWDMFNFSIPYNDKIFIPYNHNEMYYNYNEIGPEIINFIEKGKFTNKYPRKWYNWNPYKKHKR